MSTRFRPGQSGNPKGRAKGSMDRRSAWRQTLAEGLPELINDLQARARSGDDFAIKLIFDRVAPPMRPEGASVHLPKLAEGASLADKASSILSAVGEGQITVDVARSLIDTLAAAARIIETDELVRRIETLEQNLGGSR